MKKEKKLKLASATLNQTPFDWENNEKNIIEAIESSKNSGVGFLCLPELCITAYGCEDLFLAEWVFKKAWNVLENILPHTQNIVTNLGLPFFYEGKIYNVTALLCDGKILGLIPKTYLANTGVYYEQRWFSPWPLNLMQTYCYQDQKIPIGKRVFEVKGFKLGFEICEEAWVKERIADYLADQKVDIIFNPSASHFSFGKFELRKKLVLEASQKHDLIYVYSNLLGNESGRLIFDGGSLIAHQGQMLAQGKRFSFKNCELTIAEIDREEEKKTLHPLDQVFEAWEKSLFIQEEEFFRAVCLGLFDYLRKSKLQAFVISLSGGVDSAVCSILAAYALIHAKQELGEEQFFLKLPQLRLNSDQKDWVHCAYQKTINNSELTYEAAFKLAKALGVSFYEWSIDEQVKLYQNTLMESLGLSLNWKEHSLALQNIQARVRGPGIWLLANLKNALLLATSNRSEVAVGYATMDGDTCGSISPIAGVNKSFLRKWLSWFETKGPQGYAALPVLSMINQIPPTAELKPLEEKQSDEKDLMPYEVLDATEHFAIVKKLSPQECFSQIVLMFPSYSKKQLAEWVIKFFDLWCKNQWKRERYALSFHLDEENLDPKTWCRFPALSSGFELELKELKMMNY